MVVLLKRLYVHKMSRVIRMMMTMMVMMMMMMVRLRFISNLYDFTCHSIMIFFPKMVHNVLRLFECNLSVVEGGKDFWSSLAIF